MGSVGIPQGSCIGPIAFLCFINDLENVVTGAAITYADDSTFKYVGNTGDDVHSAISKDLANLQTWCADNKISINAKKTQVIVFRNGRSRPAMPPIQIENHTISQTNKVNLLGVILDDKLSGAAHVESLLKKLASVTHATRYLKNILGPTSCRLLYNSYFLSHLNYGAEYWTVCTKQQLDKLSVSQNRFLRMFRKSSRLEKQSYHILSIESLVHYLTLLVIFKNIHNLGPSVLTFERLGTVRNTRATNECILKVRSHRSHHCGLAFGAKAVRLWNNLPADIRAVNSLPLFKRRLKAYLLGLET